MGRDYLMKLHIPRALYYGIKWRKNPGIFLTIRSSMLPFPSRVPLTNIIPKSLVTLQFLKCLIFQIKAYIQGFQMRYQLFLGHWYPNSYSWFSDSMDIPFVLITTVCENERNKTTQGRGSTQFQVSYKIKTLIKSVVSEITCKLLWFVLNFSRFLDCASSAGRRRLSIL